MLKEMPKMNVGKSVNEFISQHDTKKVVAEAIKVVNRDLPVQQTQDNVQSIHSSRDSSEEARIKNNQNCITNATLNAIQIKQ